MPRHADNEYPYIKLSIISQLCIPEFLLKTSRPNPIIYFLAVCFHFSYEEEEACSNQTSILTAGLHFLF